MNKHVFIVRHIGVFNNLCKNHNNNNKIHVDIISMTKMFLLKLEVLICNLNCCFSNIFRVGIHIIILHHISLYYSAYRSSYCHCQDWSLQDFPIAFSDPTTSLSQRNYSSFCKQYLFIYTEKHINS